MADDARPVSSNRRTDSSKGPKQVSVYSARIAASVVSSSRKAERERVPLVPGSATKSERHYSRGTESTETGPECTAIAKTVRDQLRASISNNDPAGLDVVEGAARSGSHYAFGRLKALKADGANRSIPSKAAKFPKMSGLVEEVTESTVANRSLRVFRTVAIPPTKT